MKKISFLKQLNEMDCGPACLRMVAKYHGRNYTIGTIKAHTGFSKSGVSLLGISQAAENIGFATEGTKLNYDELKENLKSPCILHWDQHHYVVLINFLTNKKGGEKVKIADPAKGIIILTKQEFIDHWLSSYSNSEGNNGIALLLEPTANFFANKGQESKRLNWAIVMTYLRESKPQMFQVFVALLFTSLLQLIFPFLTQSIIDTGIKTRDLNFITIVLLAQLMLIFSRTIIDFIRSRLLLRISTIANMSILSDFWIKLTRLPMSYFDSHQTGDTLQRLNDNRQIQEFLTGNALNTIFSFFNFVVFAIILAHYNLTLLIVFAVCNTLYLLWIKLFLRLRRKINYQTFDIATAENAATLQLVQGMQEIKLHNAERSKRWEWEDIQARMFQLNFKNLSYNQVQQAGALLINQGQDIFIVFFVAGLVIKGKLTIGAMLAIQYVIGQLSGPVEQIIGFIQSAQSAKISMERLNEIHEMNDEEDPNVNTITELPKSKEIHIHNLSFSYPGTDNELVLKNIDLSILKGKTTAIVGSSGSGKTTLLKLLLKYYENYSGDVIIGEAEDSDSYNFKELSHSFWRSQCGSVLQDGFIFNDSIARNINMGNDAENKERLINSCKIANILSFIESLPNGFNTLLGARGTGLSQGQKQRLLIARAVYKNPEFLFFDEATNALDAFNERIIVENLAQFLKEKTVVVVAHRLSTVKNADKIIVLADGGVIEEGTHEELTAFRGQYYQLVKNQLELGN